MGQFFLAPFWACEGTVSMDLPWVRNTWLSSVMHNLYLWMRKSSRGHLAQLVPSVLISSPTVFLNAGWSITVWMNGVQL